MTAYINSSYPLLQSVAADWLVLLDNYKKLPYDLKYDSRRTTDVLKTVEAILDLTAETYIRNFSTALFKDSKRFQKEFRNCVENILFDYTDTVEEKSQILSYYNR